MSFSPREFCIYVDTDSWHEYIIACKTQKPPFDINHALGLQSTSVACSFQAKFFFLPQYSSVLYQPIFLVFNFNLTFVYLHWCESGQCRRRFQYAKYGRNHKYRTLIPPISAFGNLLYLHVALYELNNMR